MNVYTAGVLWRTELNYDGTTAVDAPYLLRTVAAAAAVWYVDTGTRSALQQSFTGAPSLLPGLHRRTQSIRLNSISVRVDN